MNPSGNDRRVRVRSEPCPYGREREMNVSPPPWSWRSTDEAVAAATGARPHESFTSSYPVSKAQ